LDIIVSLNRNIHFIDLTCNDIQHCNVEMTQAVNVQRCKVTSI